MTPDASHGLIRCIDSPHACVERAVSSQSAGAIILVHFHENSPMWVTRATVGVNDDWIVVSGTCAELS